MYYSHNSNIKYLCSIIKYVSFEPIYYTINLYVISCSIVFNNFDYMFLSMYYLI